jgi:uncharacterized protein (TIGR04255 family)
MDTLSPTPSFLTPPLNEVSIGQGFLPRPDLLIPHMGQFWTQIRDAYPACEHASPIIDAGSEDAGFLDPASGAPLPRVWLLSADSTQLIQLQRDRILFNWRQRPNNAEYVRFPTILAEYKRVRDAFATYVNEVSGVPPQPSAYSLMYVNLIPAGNGWETADDFKKVFRDVGWKGGARFLPKPMDVQLRFAFKLPDEFGSLKVHAHQAIRQSDKTRLIKFELAASSPPLGGKHIDFDEWVGVAHEWIVNGFKDLTTDRMHAQYWGIEGAK